MPNLLRVAIAADGRPNYLVAALAGMTAPKLSRIVNGHDAPSQTNRRRLAEVLGCEVDELFPTTPTVASVTTERRAQGLPPTVTARDAVAAVGRALARPEPKDAA
jgi:transcriptional regulator with XRE-family HTH domain